MVSGESAQGRAGGLLASILALVAVGDPTR